MIPLVLSSSPPPNAGADVPRRDVETLADCLAAPVLYPPGGTDRSLFARVERRTATDWRQAFAALRQRRTVSVYVSLSEKVGIPLALLLPKNRADRPAHVLVAHHLTSANKRVLQAHTGYLSRFDRVVTLCTAQKTYLTNAVGWDNERVTVLIQGVDTRFWSPRTAPAGEYLLAVGRERRDYATLAAALRELPETRCVVVAGSPWSRHEAAVLPGDAPPNMTFRAGLSHAELRDLYAGASVVVVPVLADTDYAAGANGCLEAMAMGRPVIATTTPGLADYQTGDGSEPLVMPVAAGDPSALAAAIRALLPDTAGRERRARAGRGFAESAATVDGYAARIAVITRSLIR